MARIAVITTKDTVWSLSCWTRTLPVLKAAGHDIAGVWTCNDRLGALKTDREIYNWYRKSFGLPNFIILAFFGVFVRIFQLIMQKPLYVTSMLRQYGIYHQHIASPNDKRFVTWVAEQGIDILVIMAPHIIKTPLIHAVRKGIINKHAAMLPANRGLFPYFWAKLKGQPQAVTFHEVTQEIDAGKILYQVEVTDQHDLSSMTAFYTHAFIHYPKGLLAAIDNLLNGVEMTSLRQLPESYHSLPSYDDYLAFRKVGGYVVRMKDLLLTAKLAAS